METRERPKRANGRPHPTPDDIIGKLAQESSGRVLGLSDPMGRAEGEAHADKPRQVLNRVAIQFDEIFSAWKDHRFRIPTSSSRLATSAEPSAASSTLSTSSAGNVGSASPPIEASNAAHSSGPRSTSPNRFRAGTMKA